MANEIKTKLGTSTTGTITLASLATSTAGVGRQSTMIDNSTDLFKEINVYMHVTTGTSPTANRAIKLYLIKGDGNATPYRTDEAGASDAGLTVITATLLAGATTTSTSDFTYTLEAVIENPGDEWGVAVVHDTGVNLNSTAGNHFFHWTGQLPEIQ